MDASDTIRKRKTQAVYIDQLNTFIAQNPAGDCAKLSTCNTASISSCVVKFPSYENKYDFFNGKNNCTGCACASNGSGR